MLAFLRGPSWFPSFPVLPIGSPINHLYLAPPSGLPPGNRPTQLTAHLTLSSGCLNGTIQSPCPKLTSSLFLKMQSCPLSFSFFFSFFILGNNITLSQLVRLKQHHLWWLFLPQIPLETPQRVLLSLPHLLLDSMCTYEACKMDIWQTYKTSQGVQFEESCTFS